MQNKNRLKARIDNNQNDIVKELRRLHGVTVDVGHDDIVVGWLGKNFWYEIKNADEVSRRTGEIKPSALTHTESNRLAFWAGHYKVVWTLDQILEDMGYGK